MNDNIKDTVREKASSLAGGAFEKQKGTALGELDNIASALRKASSELGDGGGVATKLVTTLADRVESAGRSLDGKELGDVVTDLERFARRNPATFISGAIAVGFLASRFFKSSTSAIADKPQALAGGVGTSEFGSTTGPADFPVGTDSFSDDVRGEGIMDRPLIAGMAAIAVGAIVGTIIRETDREHELFGQHRERLTSRAIETARQTVARGVAEAASSIAGRGGKDDVGTNVGPGASGS